MRRVINDDMLDRLVSYEKYVKQCFAKLARRRWVEPGVGVLEEYEQAKEFNTYLSAIVDLAFYRYGIEVGLMKRTVLHQDLALNQDLDSLLGQLLWVSRDFRSSSQERKFALVV